MEQRPREVTFRRQFGRDRGENFSLPYGVADCAAPPVSKRRSRSGPNLHSGDTHHCANGLFARNKHLVHDSASACSLVLFLARPRAGAAGVETPMEQRPPEVTFRRQFGRDRGENFSLPYGVAGLRRATSVQTPITVRAKLAFGRHAPLRERPLCPKQTPCTRFRERMQPRVVPCASARRRRRGGNLHGTNHNSAWEDSLSRRLFGRHQGEVEVSGLALKVLDLAIAPFGLHRRQILLDVRLATSEQGVDQPGQLMGGGLDRSCRVHALQTPADPKGRTRCRLRCPVVRAKYRKSTTRQVVIASRRVESTPASSRGLGPARMARPSAWTRASSSDAIRSSDSVRSIARSFAVRSRRVPTRSSRPARSSVEVAESNSASSSGEIVTSRRRISDRRRQWCFASPLSTRSS